MDVRFLLSCVLLFIQSCRCVALTTTQPGGWLTTPYVTNVEFAPKCLPTDAGCSFVSAWKENSHLCPRSSCSRRRKSLVFWLLLLSGDVHRNPGPVYKYPCTVYSRPVKKNQRGIFLNNDSLEEVTQFKYLGVTITDDLSWSKQVCSVVSKARRILGMIYHKFYRFCGTSTLLRLYKAYVKPHLDYCSFVWDPPLVKEQEAL